MDLPSPTGPGAPALKCFTNCQLCISGELIPQDLYFSPETGLITPNYYYRTEGVERIDLGGAIVAAGFLDLHANDGGGGGGDVDFASVDPKAADVRGEDEKIAGLAAREIKSGVTGFWVTVPSVEEETWKEILPRLAPRSFAHGATLLGAHCEGPYLHPSRSDTHNASSFRQPPTTSATTLYGHFNLSARGSIKLITLAPDLPGSTALIYSLLEDYPHLRISLGHTSASYEDGLAALDAGATGLTHVFNSTSPLQHQSPGLPGLITTGRCWYSVIPDGVHLHAAVLSMAFRADPTKCMLVASDNHNNGAVAADSKDRVDSGDLVISHRQRKTGDAVTLLSQDDDKKPSTPTKIKTTSTTNNASSLSTPPSKPPTIIPTTTTTTTNSPLPPISLSTSVRNLISLAPPATLAEAVRCATENIAAFMGEHKRGVLEFGRRADFAILSADGHVRQTWIGGVMVWNAG